MNARPLIKSDIAGTGIAAVQGLSGITKGNTVFIEKEERITKAFLSSTVVVNGLCTCPYLSPNLVTLPYSLRITSLRCSAHLVSALDASRLSARLAQGLWSREGNSNHGRVWHDLLDHCPSHHLNLLGQVKQLQRLPRHGARALTLLPSLQIADRPRFRRPPLLALP